MSAPIVSLLLGAALLLGGLTGPAWAQAHYRQSPGTTVVLPDAYHTPGATLRAVVRTTDASELCPVAHTAAVRNVPPAMARHVYALYGAVKKPGVCCEVDHLCSLELGCTNDLRNLWPQPYRPAPGAHEKDRLENFLHRAICTGALTVTEAQQKISTDWYRAYLEMTGGRP